MKTDEVRGKYEALQFTRMVPVQKIRGVYLLWRNDVVVYVGQSENILQRIGVHLANPLKDFDGFSYAVVEIGNLNEIEADLIVRYSPIFNKGLPGQSKYVTKGQIRRTLNIGGWELRRLIKNFTPVWRGYYLASEVLGAR